MRITVLAGDLADALADARRVVPAKPVMVAYSGVTLAVDPAREQPLAITATSGDVTLTRTVPGSDAARGTVLLPPRPLLELLPTLPKDRQMTLTADGSYLEVECGSAKPYRFRSMVETVPAVKFSGDMAADLDLSQLPGALNALKATAGDDVVSLRSAGGDLLLYSTDRVRATLIRLPGVDLGAFDVVIRISDLELLARHHVTALGISSDARRIRATGPDVDLVVHLREGFTIPDVPEFVGSLRPAHALTVSADELSDALRRLSALDDTVSEAPRVRVGINGSRLSLAADVDAVGSGEEALELAGQQVVECEALINRLYLARAAQVLTGSITWGYDHATAPMVLRPDAGEEGALDTTIVLSPMRA